MNLEYYERVFTLQTSPLLIDATSDFSWMLSRGYTTTSSLKMVGDRYRLNKTLREAVKRAGCSSASRYARDQRAVLAGALRGATVWIDGFNLLITLERALRGDPILLCQDGVVRDIAGVHGTYRRGRHTISAFNLISDLLGSLEVTTVKWLFDRPVSNSGRVAEIARAYGEAEVVNDPDQELINASPEVVVISGDGEILERCAQWFNLGSLALSRTDLLTTHALKHGSDPALRSHNQQRIIPWVIDLSSTSSSP